MIVQQNASSVVPAWFQQWLFGGLMLVLIMILLGGATRLYHAGLSIVEWELFKGVLPPLTRVKWEEYFTLYQHSSEYTQFHSWMTLADFKTIFWFEYTHRLLGRIIGLWFLIPTLKIGLSSLFPGALKKNLAGITIIIIAQGIIGWYMVKSGLGKNAAVSHYRLALHLFMALAIVSWVVKVLTAQTIYYTSKSKKPLYALAIIFGLTVLYGAFVAGLKAGLIYNTFPYMGSGVFPSDGWFYHPLFINFLKNPSFVQFMHRLLGLLTMISSWGAFAYYKNDTQRRYFLILAYSLTVQASLGIACLLTYLNFWVALAHQAMAITAWIVLTTLLVNLRKT